MNIKVHTSTFCVAAQLNVLPPDTSFQMHSLSIKYLFSYMPRQVQNNMQEILLDISAAIVDGRL